MAINFKLGPRREITDSCVWGRNWVGWDENVPADDLFDRNRGVWNIGPRGRRERYATFSFEGTVQLVAEVIDVEDVEMLDGGVKQAVVGRVLGDTDEGHRLLIDREVDAYRNPVTYIPDVLGSTVTICACGCGEEVRGGRQFAPGHDQKAIHERIKKGWGSTIKFIEWFDRNGETAGTGRGAM